MPLTKTHRIERGQKLPAVGEDEVRVLLRNLYPYQSTGPDWRHPEVLRQLPDKLVSLWPVKWSFSIICERSWRSRQVPSDWGETKVISIFKRIKKENQGTIGWSSFSSWENNWVNLETILGHMEEKEVMGNNQQEFTKVNHALPAWLPSMMKLVDL